MVLLITSGVIMSAAFPVMSRLFISSKDSLKIAMEKSSKYLLIMGLPVAAGTFLLADRIVVTIYGTHFVQAATVLRILILSIPMRFICLSLGQMLPSINREPLRTLSVGIAVLVNIALNFILIPRYGINGAGVASLASQLLMFLLFMYFVGQNFHWLPLHKMIVKPCIACAAMGALVYFIREESLFLVIPAAVILYFALLFILKTFDSRDKKVFKDMIKGRQSSPNKDKV
jgi:O-antigen/teichoic acid export membrane protein